MNDDDADFKPNQSTSSNLTSLFDTNRPRPSDNQTLTYTAPKPPKFGESSGTPVRGSSSKHLGTEKLEIIVSKNIQLFKLENGKYVGQGAAGIAIIGHYDLHMYQIILYKNNKEYLSKTYVQPNFIFTVLENNYASFYDNSRQNWSILFPSSSDVQHFAKQVAIAKYNSQSKQDKIIVQDLIPLGLTKANKKDVIKLECSCCLLNNDDVAPLKESSNWSVEVTDTYAFPWQEGLRDCGYKCKRVVIVPYKLSAPWTDEIQQNSSVLVELEVVSVTPSGRQGKPGIPVKSKIHDESTTDSSADEDNCKAKPSSLTDSIFLSRSHKADLISRIAKMGQALPLKVAFACGPSDSSDESSQSRHGNRPCSPQHTDTHQQYLLSTSSSRRCENEVAWQQQQMRGGMNFAYQELYPMMSGPPGPSGQNFPRGTETTGTDAELRLTINKVSEKVDYVLNKLQNFDAAGWDKVKAHQSATLLDPVSVINSIQDVIAENESLKMEIQQQKSKINEQGSKLHSLMELTQRCVERCAYTERKPGVIPAPTGLEERLNPPDQLMAEANRRVNELTNEIEKYRREISENQQQIKQCNVEIQDLVDKLKEKERVIRNMETVLSETSAEREALMSANEKHKREMSRAKEQERASEVQSSSSSSSSSEELIEEIKKVMNAVNRKLQSYFDSHQSYSGKDIKATIATTLKDVTMEYLKYRTKQRASSRLDTSQRDIPGSPDERRGLSHLQSTEKADQIRAEKSKMSQDLKKVVSQRLAFADEQPSQLSMSVRGDSLEEPDKLPSRITQEPSVRSSTQPSPRLTTDASALAHDLKTMESLVHPTAPSSSLYQSMRSSDTVRAMSSQPVTGRPTSSPIAGSHDMQSSETFRGDSERAFNISSRTDSQMTREQSSRIQEDDETSKHSSSATSTRTLPAASKPSVLQPTPRKSSLTTSRLPSGVDEIRGVTSTMTGELESLLEDHEAEEVEKSTVTLTNTLSDVTRGPSTFPSSSPRVGLSNVTEESGRSTLTSMRQPTETEESFVFVDGDESRVASSRIIPESGRSTRAATGVDERLGTRSGDDSFVVVGEESTANVSGMSSRGVVDTEPGTQTTSGRSTRTAERLPSELNVSFAQTQIHSGSEVAENEPFGDISTNTIGSIGHTPPRSDMSTYTGGERARNVRKSLGETDLGAKMELSVEGGSVMNVETEKSSVMLNKTPSNITKDAAPSERSTPTGLSSDYESSLKEDFEETKSLVEDERNEEEKSYLTGEAISREEIDSSKEKDEGEKSSIDEKVSSSTSDENFRTSGSNVVHESPLYSDYYQGWESSKPPPLPLEDDEEASGTDEEWL